MPTTSRYDDPCGIARALDVLGDRWALLVVRELVFGGKRFAQIRKGLHGISPNVLSQRLRELEAGGVLRRTVLEPPGDVTLYELTDRGRALEPVLIELGRWGSLEPLTTDRELSTSALLIALETVFDPDASRDGVVAIRIDDEPFTLTITQGSLDIHAGWTTDADVVLETDAATLRAFAFGRETLSAAEGARRLRVTGDRALAEQLVHMFPAPRRT